MTRVLVVEDEPALLRTLVLNLSHRGYEVSTAVSGRGAVASAIAHPPDLLVLDLGLPDIDGIDVIEQIHATVPAIPIVVLSARSGSHDKVTALDLGAVDYVTKPFDVAELVARLRAAARRTEIAPAPLVIEMGPVRIDVAARLVHRTDGPATDGPATDSTAQEIHLTPTEWRMLETLLRHPGTLVTSRDLLTALRGDPEHTESSYLRIYMAQLRKKLETVPGRPRYLLTEPGIGYRFRP